MIVSMYFRIYEPAGRETLVIESDCSECAGDCAAALVLGPGPWPDGYMDGIDYGVIEARGRDELEPGDVVVMAVCTCTGRERGLWEEESGGGEDDVEPVSELVN